MINRAISFGVLLFAFALTLLGFQPQGKTTIFSITIPVFGQVVYWILGTIAIVASLLFFIMGARRNWAESTERFLDNNVNFFPIWVIFWGMYTISYIKGFAAVVQAAPPAWLVYLTLFFGFAGFLYIGVMGLIRISRQ